MYIKIYNNDGRSESCADILRGMCLPPWIRGIHLLPIPTSADGVHLGRGGKSIFELEIGEGEVYCGYALPSALVGRIEACGGIAQDAVEDEELLLDNAYLTALASLGYILHNYSMDIERPLVGVIGYGRIGEALVRMLLALGIPPMVYTGRREVREELGSLGISSSGYSTEASFDRVSLLVNTAPAITLSPPEDLPILELASGESFPGREVMRLPALPARHYPLAAGRAWARSIYRFLTEVHR